MERINRLHKIIKAELGPETRADLKDLQVSGVSLITAVPVFCISKPARTINSLDDEIASDFVTDSMGSAIHAVAGSSRFLL